MAAGQLEAEQLRRKADEFASKVAGVVSAFTNTEHAFVASAVDNRVSIRHRDAAEGTAYGIPLRAEGETLLSLVVDYDCSWDSTRQYLSVERSVTAVYPLTRTSKDPLFRYEYIRRPGGVIPCSHLQVHAHRDSFTHLLGYAGPHSKRARRRQGRGLDRSPSVSEFHFPLGGPRFRPPLEDILAVLAEEFGLETGGSWRSVAASGRAEWRRIQVASSVRDAPETAAQVLRELGYEVHGPVLPDRLEKLELL